MAISAASILMGLVGDQLMLEEKIGKGLNVFLTAVVFCLVMVFPGDLWAVEYPSLYGYGQTMSYCSAKPCGSTPGCEEHHTCGADLPYRYTKKITGFRDLYNPNDPRILCGEDINSIEDCAAEEKSLQLNLTTFSPYYYDYVPGFPDAFKIFIPAGTVRGNITILMPLDESIGFAVRYGRPPAATNFTSPQSVPWDPGRNANLETMAERDVYLQNNEGAAVVLSTFVSRTPMTEGGWLYIRKMPFSGSVLHIVKVNLKVNVDAYRDWYNGVRWDANGDPTSEPACAVAEECSSELMCTGSRFYWYDDSCHEEPRCRLDNLCGCVDVDECRALVDENGEHVAYWYDDGSDCKCHENPVCTAEDGGCETRAECEEGSGLYWYEDESGEEVCNPNPACDRDSLEDCNSQLRDSGVLF